jgi:hypothetical protein
MVTFPASAVAVVIAVSPFIMITIAIPIMMTVVIAMFLPVIVFVIVMVAGQRETAEHQSHCHCQGCQLHASHSSSHTVPSSERLIAITPALDRLLGPVCSFVRMPTRIELAVFQEHIFSNLK